MLPDEIQEKNEAKKADSSLSSVTVTEADRRLVKQLCGLADSTPPKYLHRVLQEHLSSLPPSIQAAIKASR